MATYTIVDDGRIDGAWPFATVAPGMSASAQGYCSAEPPKEYALKVRIKDIICADKSQLEAWVRELQDHVNQVMHEDNSTYTGDAVSKSQVSVWMNCFEFIAANLKGLDPKKQEFELVFEYSLPGTVHKRPDVLLVTERKVLSLEFKRKSAPQVDDNKDDVAQAMRYKEWLENHHKVTKDRSLEVKSYLVCTHNFAASGYLRGIRILSKSDFLSEIDGELKDQSACTFIDEWLASAKTEMPDMLQAIEILYRDGRIPYISDVNEKCLKKVLRYISAAKRKHAKLLILINGVPGAGKTAVGQSVVYEENRNGQANAVYLSGNGPLVEVLQYQINQVGRNEHMGENAIQNMKDFKKDYFSNFSYQNLKVPQQSILIFDEAQRAWDAAKLKRGFSEPDGLFDVGDRIFRERGYAVLIGLYGNGQAIYDGEEVGLELWQQALTQHQDWLVLASDAISAQLQGLDRRLRSDNDVFLPVSLRADFIDCSRWVEQAISRNGATFENARDELAALQNTSMRICVTRDMAKVRARVADMDADHTDWKYGILISNFAEQSVVRKALPGWDIGYNGVNSVSNGSYGPWFGGGCKALDKACSVYGNQGLELDCPIVLFGGGYIRRNGQWVSNGTSYDKQKYKFQDPDTIVENNYRVLLTRARKEMILLIPEDKLLDETYRYFVEMGMDVL